MNAIKQILKAVCYVGLYFIMQLAVTFAASICYSIYLGIQLGLSGADRRELDANRINQMVSEKVLSQTSLLVVLAGVFTLLILVVWFRIRKKRLLTEACLGSFDRRFWPGVFVGAVGLCLAVNFGMQLIPVPEGIMEEYVQASESLINAPFLLLLICNVVMAPVLEEILFRGLAISRLQKVFPAWAAVLISSALFGLMHGQILWMCYTFFVGLVLGTVMIKTGSARACMIIHAVFNLFGTCISSLDMELTLGKCIVYAVCGFILVGLSLMLLSQVSGQIREEGNAS